MEGFSKQITTSGLGGEALNGRIVIGSYGGGGGGIGGGGGGGFNGGIGDQAQTRFAGNGVSQANSQDAKQLASADFGSVPAPAAPTVQLMPPLTTADFDADSLLVPGSAPRRLRVLPAKAGLRIARLVGGNSPADQTDAQPAEGTRDLSLLGAIASSGHASTPILGDTPSLGCNFRSEAAGSSQGGSPAKAAPPAAPASGPAEPLDLYAGVAGKPYSIGFQGGSPPNPRPGASSPDALLERLADEPKTRSLATAASKDLRQEPQLMERYGLKPRDESRFGDSANLPTQDAASGLQADAKAKSAAPAPVKEALQLAQTKDELNSQFGRGSDQLKRESRLLSEQETVQLESKADSHSARSQAGQSGGVPIVAFALSDKEEQPVALRGGRAAVQVQSDAADKKLAERTLPAPALQPEIETSANPFSTFSLNVSDVSFKLAAASLERGQMPDPASVRSEEFINAFDYRDPDPGVGTADCLCVGAGALSVCARPRPGSVLDQDGSRGQAIGGAAEFGAVAGSVRIDGTGRSRPDCRRSASRAHGPVAAAGQAERRHFRPHSSTVGRWLAGDQVGSVLEEVANSTPEGGTNLEEALQLAYQTALRHHLERGVQSGGAADGRRGQSRRRRSRCAKQKVEALSQARHRAGLLWDRLGRL